MKRFLGTLLILCMALTTAIAQQGDGDDADMTFTLHENEAVIYVAGGCFWGMEKLMSLIPGVTDAVSGYANGTVERPTYQEVCTGATGHRETVRVVYRPAEISLREILSVYFSAIDPTVENRQGNDVGQQYQTGIFYADPKDEAEIQAVIQQVKPKYDRFYVEVAPLTSFYEAEPEHQDYLDAQPNGYCHVSPQAFELARNIKAAAADYHSVPPEMAKAWMDGNEEMILLDVRTREEYAQGHIPGATLLPLDQIGTEPPADLPDKDGKIVVYCRSGRRSMEAANRLVAMGYTAVYDLGGIRDWPYETVTE